MKQSLTTGDILLQVTLWMTSNVTLKIWHVTSFLSHGTYFNRSWSNQLFQWTCYRLYLPMHVIHRKTERERKKVAFVYLFSSKGHLKVTFAWPDIFPVREKFYLFLLFCFSSLASVCLFVVCVYVCECVLCSISQA